MFLKVKVHMNGPTNNNYYILFITKYSFLNLHLVSFYNTQPRLLLVSTYKCRVLTQYQKISSHFMCARLINPKYVFLYL